MIYFLYGSDRDKARAKAHELMNALIAKKPDALLFSFDSENFDPVQFQSLIGSQGLFERNNIIFLNGVLENDEWEEIVLSKLSEMEETTNVCILLESEPKKSIRERIEKHSAKAQELALKEKPKTYQFNSFSLTDALGARDKKELWSLYQEAQFEEKAPEELHGLLFWQMKAMLQAASAKSADEAALKPFVYGKASRYAKNYSLAELKKKSSELVDAYHIARRGGDEMREGLEKWILGL